MVSPFGEPASIFAADQSIYNPDTQGAITKGESQELVVLGAALHPGKGALLIAGRSFCCFFSSESYGFSF